jgi:peptide subunit release factor RF-3
MKITIESTTKVIDIGRGLQARLWEGRTSSGTPVEVFITRIAVSKDAPSTVLEQFERELAEQRAPSVAWPARLILW